jgi:hypothetical protein
MGKFLGIIIGIAVIFTAGLGAFLAPALFIGTTIGGVMTASAIFGLGVSMTMQGVIGALRGGPSISHDPVTSQLTVRQPISYRRIIYGSVRTGGVLTYIGKSGSNGEYIHLVLTLAGHQVHAISNNMYFDGVLVPLAINGGGASDGYLHPSSGKYVAHCLVEKHLGDPSDTSQPFPALHADLPEWSNTCLQRGSAKVHVRLKWDQDIFPSGLPQSIAFDVDGKEVYDPRTSTTGFSHNPALCLRDWLTDEMYGMGADAATIDDDYVEAAANICDENVALKAGGTQKRYTCDGMFESSSFRGDVIKGILTSMAGICIPPGNAWRMYAGAWRSSVMTLTDSDLRGPIKMDTKMSRRDLANGIKGTYVSSANNWQPSDFPPYLSSTYVTEDGGEKIWKDIQLGFTTDGIRAQRLAKIHLMKIRRQISLILPCKITALKAQPGDTVAVTHANFGFSAKTFEVLQTSLVQDTSTKDGIGLGVDLVLKETDADVYAWDETTDEGTVTNPAVATLPDMGNVGAPSNLALTAVETTRTDGIRHLQIKATWTSPTDHHVLSGGHIQIWMKKHSGSTFVRVGIADGSDTEFYITQNVIDGEHYDVEICSVNSKGVRSAFIEVDNYLASASIVSFAGTVTSLDNVNDGTTYARPLATRINAGKPVIDFAESIHSNKILDNLADGTYAKPLATRINAGKPVIDFSESIHANKNIDNVDDGSIFARPTFHQATETVDNGNFEASSSLVNSYPPAWQAFGTGQTISYETGSPQSGVQSLKVVSTGTAAGAKALRKFKVVPGEVWKISGYIKSDGTFLSTISFDFRDSAGSFLSRISSAATVSASWTAVSDVGTAPANAVYAEIVCFNSGHSYTAY